MLEKFHLREGGNQDPGDQGVGKVRGGGRIFFPSSSGELMLGDIMRAICEKPICMGNTLPVIH